jgi:hypothetical protein
MVQRIRRSSCTEIQNAESVLVGVLVALILRLELASLPILRAFWSGPSLLSCLQSLAHGLLPLGLGKETSLRSRLVISSCLLSPDWTL